MARPVLLMSSNRPDRLEPRGSRNAPPSSAWKFWRRALLYGAVHYVVLAGLSGVIFLTSHIPPKAVHLDPLIGVLVGAENVLVAPRRLAFACWPFEATPAGAGLALTILNSAVWGMAVAMFLAFRQRLHRPGRARR